MTARTENTAVGRATIPQDDDPRSPYSPNNLMLYHVSLGLIEKLVRNGQLSQADFNKSRRILNKKYAIPSDSIFAETA